MVSADLFSEACLGEDSRDARFGASGFPAQQSESAWAVAFRAKVDQVLLRAGDLDWTAFGRTPSRLWLMDSDEIDRMPMAEFIAAFGVPRDEADRLIAACQSAGRPSGHGDSAAPIRDIPSSHTIVPASARNHVSSSASCGSSWWSLSLKACAAAAAILAVLSD